MDINQLKFDKMHLNIQILKLKIQKNKLNFTVFRMRF
jgi:hypothetical protein